MIIRSSKFVRGSILIFVIGVIVFYSYHRYVQAQYATLYLQNGNYPVQIGMFDLYREAHYDVVMLGNSHTYNAEWNELLGRRNIANRGIVGDITAGYLHRLRYVYQLTPRICFIEGGVNDVYANYSPEQIVENYERIIDTLRSHSIVPVIQSTLFVARRWNDAANKNAQIAALNEMLTEYAAEQGIVYLDINSLVSAGGYLRDELTYDGIHLTAAGYALWVPVVDTILNKQTL